MKLREAISKMGLVHAIPTIAQNKSGQSVKMDSSTHSSVILARVSYDKAFADFQEKAREVLKGLKPEGYDEREQKISRMREIDRRAKAAKEWNGEGEEPAMPTKEELKEADEIRPTEEAFKKETDELNEQFIAAQEKILDEEVTVPSGTLTKKELADICNVVDSLAEASAAEGKQAVIPVTLTLYNKTVNFTTEDFLQMVAVELVA